MKINLMKISLLLMLAFATTISLSSCGDDKAKEGDDTEQVDGDKKCEEGKCEEGKCEEGDEKCEEGKCEEGKCEEGKGDETEDVEETTTM